MNKAPSNMNTPGTNFEPTRLLNSAQSTNLQDVLKRDFANFFLGNKNPLVTLVHGIQLIRFSLFMFQRDCNKSLDNNTLNQEKKMVNVKDFNSLLYENNFQDLQLSFINPVKNDLFLLNPMTEIELSQMEMNVDTQNALINMSKMNNLTNSNFLQMPQNFSPFVNLISPNFTPIMNRGGFNTAPNMMNSNNMLGFNNINSNFSSPAVNFNLFNNHNEFLLSKILENMNNSNNSSISNNGNNLNNNPNNLNQNNLNNLNNLHNLNNLNKSMEKNGNTNNKINIKMEVDDENSLLKKRLKDL